MKGKKSKRNAKINRILARLAATMGLSDYCELRLSKCTGGLFTGWAHSKRRNSWVSERDQYEVVRACTNCHTEAQNEGNEENERIILAAIERRGYDFAELIGARV